MVEVTTKDRVKKVLGEVFDTEPSAITDEMNFSEEFDIDSLDMLDLMFRLENEFDIGYLQDSFKKQIPHSLKEIVSVIQKKLQEKDLNS